MSIEYKIINYLKNNPEKGTREIARGINAPRYRVVFAISKLLWQQRIALAGHMKSNKAGECHPTYRTTLYRGATVQ